MDVFLRYEISARELDASILTALVAAGRGHRVLVCDWATMMRQLFLRRKHPGFVHMNSITPSWRTEIFHSIFRFFRFKISSLDQEAGIQRKSFESFADARFGESSIRSTDIVFCWGSSDQEVLRRRYPHHSHKFLVSGSPRVDLWAPRFSQLYSGSKHSAHPRILVLSSISGPFSRQTLREELLTHRESGYFERDPGLRDQLVGKFKEGAELMLQYLKVVRSLSMNFPRAEILIKPHPSEDSDTWREVLNPAENIAIDLETPTSELIRVSNVAITTGSSTAFEAVFSGTPLISFQPFIPEFRQYDMADNVGKIAHSIDDVLDIVRNVLYSPAEDRFSQQSASSLANLREKIFFDDKELAAERLVRAWELELGSSEDPGESTDKLRKTMTKQQLGYYLASAFPVVSRLINHRRGEPGGRLRSNWKRPPIDRLSVLARVEEMTKVLNMSQTVSVRFKGPRSLVLEVVR